MVAAIEITDLFSSGLTYYLYDFLVVLNEKKSDMERAISKE